MPLQKIGITLGDPGGIGPEVTLKALASPQIPEAEYVLFASSKCVEAEAERLNLRSALNRCRLQDPIPDLSPESRGTPTEKSGKTSFAYVAQAVDFARRGRLQAIVTAPISKHSWQLAGIPWAGHTDYLEHYYPDAVMSFFSERLNLALYTHHLPLRRALEKIRRQPLQEFLVRLYSQIRPVLGEKCQLLMSGLNPHAGEKGLLGSEEIEEIIPALKAAQSQGVPISGPHPPDIICRMALDRPHILGVSLYHDQGLIAFKLIAFDSGVNVTLGLPFVRTSPDHGTAFDIAGHDQADAGSMIAAVRLAHRFVSISA